MMKTVSHAVPRRYSIYLLLFLFLLAVYLLTYTPRVNSSDGIAMVATAESLVRRGALDVEQIRWMGLQQGTYGLDGLLYSRKGIGVPLGLLPLVWLGLTAPGLGPVSLSLLFNALVTALTAVFLLSYLTRLGFSSTTGLLTALTFGLGTLAWPYAKSLFSDPFSGLLLLGAAWLLLAFRRTGRSRYAFGAGLLLGWNVATRYAEALFLPVFGLLLLYYLVTNDELRFTNENFVTRHSSLVTPVLAFAAPIAAVGLSLMAFNLSRYGDPFNTGYLPTETFSAVWWRGIAGQLVSPGRGLLLYSPIFILTFFSAPAFFRRHRPEAALALSIILIHLLLYGKWFMWHGGFAWGPRFLIPTLPFWALLLAPAAEWRGWWRSLFAGLAILGAGVQVQLVLVDFSPFQGFLLDTGLPLFEPQTFFDPQYSPLLHGWGFITRQNLDVAWAWQGRVNGWLLVALLANIALTGWFLWRVSTNQQTNQLTILPFLTTLAATVFLLTHAHTLPPQPLQAAVAELNRGVRPADAVILNHPEATLDFAELYKGRAPVLGLNSGGFPLPDAIARRLDETLAGHAQVWWLPNWLPPAESAIEQTLLARGFRARDEDFAGQRLALFALSADLPARFVNRLFGDAIELTGIAAPVETEAGAALPVELRWTARQPVGVDYRVFIHVVDGQGHKIAQADGQPVNWSRPTSTWAVGEKITDRYGVWLPPETLPGDYSIQVGLYNPADGVRLSLPDGTDAVGFTIAVK
jgi:hypothetical protein